MMTENFSLSYIAAVSKGHDGEEYCMNNWINKQF